MCFPARSGTAKSETFPTKKQAESRWKELRQNIDAAVIDKARGIYVERNYYTVGNLA